MRPMNQCATCGEDFVSLEGFDAHRVGEHDYTFAEGLRMNPPVEDGRRCLDVAEMLEAGWHRDKNGRWVVAEIAALDLARVEL